MKYDRKTEKYEKKVTFPLRKVTFFFIDKKLNI